MADFEGIRRGYAQHLEKERNLSVHTVRAYLGDLDSFLDHLSAQKIEDVGAISIAHIRSWLANVQVKGGARTTLSRRATSIRLFTKWATKCGYVAKDVGATLKRITGVTTVNDKYVVVRSMGDRWNQAVMDGVNLPSTDPTEQQFSFDIIPTAMVESIVVSKNATPDMNANFAGGYVEIRTKAIPKNNFTSFSIGTSYNSISTFNERLTKKEGAYDYLGFDDGSKSYPSGLAVLPIPTKESESGAFIEQSKLFKNDNFTTYKTYAAPGTSLQFALGRAYDISDKSRWGFVGSLLF